ncbi:DTW domain-containing protein [bacterium]|nr:DTW domain-containing protein [bacterium]
MQIDQYLARRAELEKRSPEYHERCWDCLRPKVVCYCSSIKKFNPGIKFVILTHLIEFRRRIASGRMSYLCLQESEFIVGLDFAEDRQVQAIVDNEKFDSYVLYPGEDSLNLSDLSEPSRLDRFYSDKQLCIFVVDGTWNTAKKMINRSPNLVDLPRICFTPETQSNFRVRKQPGQHCLSTIEAIHQCIELLGPSRGFDLESGQHHNLLEAFDSMVDKQIEYINQSKIENRGSRHKRGRA